MDKVRNSGNFDICRRDTSVISAPSIISSCNRKSRECGTGTPGRKWPVGQLVISSIALSVITLQAKFKERRGGAWPVFIADTALHDAPFSVSFRNIGLRESSHTICRYDVLLGNASDSGARRSSHFNVPGVKLSKCDRSTDRHKCREQTVITDAYG